MARPIELPMGILTYSAGGWRVEYAVIPANDFGEAIHRATLAYASGWSAASAPAQEAAVIAFDTTPEMDLYGIQVTFLHKQSALELLGELLGLGLVVAKSQGAFYVYLLFQPFASRLGSLESG